MKKSALTAVLLLLCMTLFGQSQMPQHLSFKGHPINGSIKSFVDGLKADGFKSLRVTNEGIWLKGSFATRECEVLVKSSTTSGSVYSVTAKFPTQETWNAVKNEYSILKDFLTKKYGEPVSVEEFKPYTKPGDGYEFMHMRDGYVTWKSVYSSPLGVISLSIESVSIKSGCVWLSYTDNKNNSKSKSEHIDDL